MPAKHYDGPYVDAEPVTPSDTVDLAKGATSAIFVGTAGALSVIMAGNATPATFGNVPAGTTLRIAVRRVRATGTTATNVVALY